MTMQGFALAQDGHDCQGPPDEAEPPSDEHIRERAYSMYMAGWHRHDLDVADDAPVERVDGGYWVTARLWVPEDEV